MGLQILYGSEDAENMICDSLRHAQRHAVLCKNRHALIRIFLLQLRDLSDLLGSCGLIIAGHRTIGIWHDPRITVKAAKTSTDSQKRANQLTT